MSGNLGSRRAPLATTKQRRLRRRSLHGGILGVSSGFGGRSICAAAGVLADDVAPAHMRLTRHSDCFFPPIDQVKRIAGRTPCPSDETASVHHFETVRAARATSNAPSASSMCASPPFWAMILPRSADLLALIQHVVVLWWHSHALLRSDRPRDTGPPTPGRRSAAVVARRRSLYTDRSDRPQSSRNEVGIAIQRAIGCDDALPRACPRTASRPGHFTGTIRRDRCTRFRPVRRRHR